MLPVVSEEFELVCIFVAIFFFSLLFSISKRSTVAKTGLISDIVRHNKNKNASYLVQTETFLNRWFVLQVLVFEIKL